MNSEPAAARAYLLCGPSLAGKSTLAAALQQARDVACVSADAINAQRGLPFGAEGLPESVWAETLRLELAQLAAHAAQGRSVVVDDTLCYRWLRERMRAACAQAGLQPVLLLLRPSEAELLARHAQLLASGARPVLSRDRLLEHLASFEWPLADEAALDLTARAARDAFVAAQAAPNAA